MAGPCRGTAPFSSGQPHVGRAISRSVRARGAFAVLMALLFACKSSSPQAPQPTASASATLKKLTPAEIAERTLPAMALIKTEVGLGSGFVVGADGRIATNLHVITGVKEATVVLADSREFKEIEVIAVDFAHDLVLIRVNAKGLVPLALGDSTHVQAGEPVVAIGHPLGLG